MYVWALLYCCKRLGFESKCMVEKKESWNSTTIIYSRLVRQIDTRIIVNGLLCYHCFSPLSYLL